MLLIERWVLREMFIVAASVRAFLLPLCAIQNAAVTSRCCHCGTTYCYGGKDRLEL